MEYIHKFVQLCEKEKEIEMRKIKNARIQKGGEIPLYIREKMARSSKREHMIF